MLSYRPGKSDPLAHAVGPNVALLLDVRHLTVVGHDVGASVTPRHFGRGSAGVIVA